MAESTTLMEASAPVEVATAPMEVPGPAMEPSAAFAAALVIAAMDAAGPTVGERVVVTLTVEEATP